MANSGEGYAYIEMNIGVDNTQENSGEGYAYIEQNYQLYVISAGDSMPPIIN